MTGSNWSMEVVVGSRLELAPPRQWPGFIFVHVRPVITLDDPSLKCKQLHFITILPHHEGICFLVKSRATKLLVSERQPRISPYSVLQVGFPWLLVDITS